jgi:uncharacterized protein with GYD domain
VTSVTPENEKAQAMATYVVLINFTEQGARAVRNTRRRADAFRAAAESAGVSVRDVYWTLGHYDGLLVLEASDDHTVTALLLDLATLGNVRTQTLRAFGEAEVGAILGNLPRTGGAGTRGETRGKTRGGARGGRAKRR